jgi:phosphoribosylglycinamide formyltransferase 2
MSSSGKGQSVVRNDAGIERSWNYAQAGARGNAGPVIVEGFIDFDYEITLLTVRHADGTSFCAPVGHRQVDGDYQESWQPQPMTREAQEECERIATLVTNELGGYGIFGAEFFIKGNQVWFSEISPRPTTGMVTMISQDLSQFACMRGRFCVCRFHDRAARSGGVGSHHGRRDSIELSLTVWHALATPGTQVRLFGKPEVRGKRRMGVALATGNDIEEARAKARAAAAKVRPKFS